MTFVLRNLLTVTAIVLAFGPAIVRAQASRSTQDIHGIDFRNFTYRNTGCAGDSDAITVKNGIYELDDEDNKVYFEIQEIVYGDLTGDGVDEAVVRTLCNTGGTGQFTDAVIFTLRAGKLTVLGTLGVGDRADGGLYAVEVRGGLLYQSRFGNHEGGGACCPEYVETSPVRWNGKQFVDAGKPTRRVYQDYLTDDSPAPHAIKFIRGTSAATLVGLTNDGESYHLGARAGQTLTLHLTTKDTTAEAAVTSKDGQMLGTATGASTLTIKLPATGDYLITFRSSKGKDADDNGYSMDVSIL